MIGIIFSPAKLKRIVMEKEKHEHVEYYYHLANENEVDLLFYTVRSLFQDSHKVEGYHYSYTDKQLIKQVVDIPRVNLFRTVVHKKAHAEALSKIEKAENVSFINMTMERNKFRIYQYLKCIKKIKDHIPSTDRLSYKRLLHFLDTYRKVVIKPTNGAQGEKIYVVEKRNKQLLVHYTRKGKPFKRILRVHQFLPFYKKCFPSPSSYLIQEWISFQRYEGEKFDIRTSVQKDKEGQWQVTGIVGRVAGRDGIVTNIAQGGRAVPFRNIHPVLEREIHAHINQLSLRIASALEELHSSTADLGLDIAIDENYKLWFIEANYCDERYSYRESMDFDMWQASYRTPFEYAYATYTNE